MSTWDIDWFHWSILPACLVRWIAEALPHASSRTAPWAESAKEVLDRFRAADQSYPDRLQAAAVARFLYGERSWRFDWRKDKGGWRGDLRKMLVTNECDPAEWLQPDWTTEPNDKGAGLVRAGERLATLRRDDERFETWRVPWHDDWRRRLDETGDPEKLSAFIRMRLIELADCPALAEEPEAQTDIAMLVAEVGAPFEMRRMFDLLCGADQNAWQRPLSAPREQARLAFLRALVRWPELARRDEAQRLNAESPFRRMLRASMVDEADYLVRRAVFFSRIPAAGRVDYARELLFATRPREFFRYQRPLPLVVGESLAERPDRLVVPTAHEVVEGWQMSAVTTNANDGTTSIYCDDLEPSEALSRFGLTQEAFDERGRAKGGPIRALALVARVERGDPGRRPDRCHLNFGARYTQAVDVPPGIRGADLSLGDAVVVTLEPKTMGGQPTWAFPPTADRIALDVLRRRRVEGAPSKVRVRPFVGAPPVPALEVAVKAEDDHEPLVLKRKGLWDPDTSRLFVPAYEKETNAWAVEEAPGVWRPMHRDVLLLLAEGLRFDHGRMAVLAFVDEGCRGDGTVEFRFAMSPGLLIGLTQADLSGDDWDELAQALESSEAAAGLLVAVRVDDDDALRLTLARDRPADAEVERRYPDLTVPFDDRNRRWRELLRDAEGGDVVRREGRWWLVREDAPLPFPSRIPVEWKGPTPGGDGPVEVTIERWSEDEWRHGRVVVRAVQVESMVLPRGREAAFVRAWLGADRGDLFELSEIRGKVSPSGLVAGFTPERAPIHVEIDSVDPFPTPIDTRIEAKLRRTVRLMGVDWNPTRPPQIASEVLPEVLRAQGHAAGVVVETPRMAGAGTRCFVAWLEGEQFRRTGVHIENLSELGSRLIGARIDADGSSGQWVFTLSLPYIRCRALWTIDRTWAPRASAETWYLGAVPLDQEPHHLVWLGPGALGAFRADDSEDVLRHLEHMVGGRSTGHDLRWVVDERGVSVPTRNVGKLGSWDYRGRRFRKAMLEVRDYGGDLCVLAGTCDDSAPSERAALTDVELEVHTAATELFDVRRHFLLRARAPVSVPRPEARKVTHSADRVIAPSGPGQDLVWIELWRTYCEAPREVGVEFRKVEKDLVERVEIAERLRVPASGTWASRVPILDNTFVQFAVYDRADAIARLVQRDAQGPWGASFRAVAPLAVDEFRRYLGAGYDRLVTLVKRSHKGAGPLRALRPDERQVPLHYVGRETVKGEEGRDQTFHRFEWGFGRVLRAPEDLLRYDDGPFSGARLTLFHGDVVTAVTFRDPAAQAGPDGSTINPEANLDIANPRCVMDLQEVHMRYAPGTRLYEQRKKFKIIHVLDLSRTGGAVTIDTVKGFAQRHPKDALQAYEALHARLDEGDAARLLARFPSKFEGSPPAKQPGGSSRETRTILGRLDTQRFEESCGRELVFQHVRMTLDAPGTVESLEVGDRIFVEAGRIERRGNETPLFIHALSDLSEQDVGRDMGDLALLKRSFSVRADLLGRLLTIRPDVLQGTELFVQLGWDGTRDRPKLSLIENPISRDPRALASAVKSGEGFKFALVSDVTGESVWLEADPGIFVRLDRQSALASADDFSVGSVVRVELDPSSDEEAPRFQLWRASYGDLDYISEIERGVVALPTNPLLASRAIAASRDGTLRWQSKEGAFTLGDFPNLVAHFVPPAGSRGRAAAPCALMAAPHPKIAVAALGFQHARDPLLRLPPHTLIIGKLEHHRATRTLYAIFRRGCDEEPSLNVLPWHRASFGDEPVEKIKERTDGYGWRYHDVSTGYWSGEEVERHPTPWHDAWSGPLFFSAGPDGPMLRHDTRRLREFGFPVDVLVRALRERKDGPAPADFALTLPVAAVPKDGGLWLELAPGRLVEVPPRLIVKRLGGAEISLANLSWAAFSPADRVTLRLASSDPFALDLLELVDWEPGARGALGPRSLLPIDLRNPPCGFARYGAGRFLVTLPCPEPASLPDLVALTSDNVLQDAAGQLPQPDDTILLVARDEDPLDGSERDCAASALRVAGFPDLVAVPELHAVQAWKVDPLRDAFVEMTPNGLQPAGRLRDFVRAAGGAVPVTVVRVLPDRGELRFTRKHQVASRLLATGQYVLGRACAMISNAELLVRCGGGFLSLPFGQVLPGIPPREWPAVADALRRERVPIWIRQLDGGALVTGLRDEPSTEVTFEPLLVVDPPEGERGVEPGLVGRSVTSGRLYWLPAREAAWAPLPVEVLKRLLLKKGPQHVPVLRGPRDTVSAIRAKQAKAEFEHLSIGRELRVTILERATLRRAQGAVNECYYAQSTTSQTILLCQKNGGDALSPGMVLPAEVVRRRVLGSSRALTVVPAGTRTLSFDLPSEYISGIDRRSLRRIGLAQQLAWRQESPELPPMPYPRDDEPEESLVRTLCHAYTRFQQAGFQVPGQAEGAAWNPLPGAAAAYVWLARHRGDAQMPLHVPLLAIALLHASALPAPADFAAFGGPAPGEAWAKRYRESAAAALRDLGRRAVRSFHVELLERLWFGNEEVRARTTGIWARLRTIEPSLRANASNDDFNLVRRFCRAVELRTAKSFEDCRLVGEALRAAMGETVDVDGLANRKKAELAWKLVHEIHRPFLAPRGDAGVPFDDRLADRVRKLLSLVEVNAIDLTLLEPVPDVDAEEFPGRS